MHNDIPEAQRQQAPTPKRKSASSISPSKLLGLVGIGAVLLGVGWVLIGRGGNSASRANAPSASKRADTQGRSDIFGHLPFQEASDAELTALQDYPEIRLQVSAAIAFEQMMRDARAEGIELVALSGFRTEQEQEYLFFEVKKERSQVASKRAEVSAPPGYSEHHTGFAVDIGDANAPQTHVEVEFAQTAAFRWLDQHAARYSFELSFPEGNAQGVSYEPWHWRFVGDQASLEAFHKGR